MGYLFPHLGDDKVLSLSLSTVAIGLSCYTLWRNVSSERRMRALTFAQRKIEALNLITNGEIASLATQDSWREIEDDARQCGLEDIIIIATEFVSSAETKLAQLQEARAAIVKQQAKTMTHEQLLQFIEDHIAALEDLVNIDKTAGEQSSTLREVRLQIKLCKDVDEKFNKTVSQIDSSRRAFSQFYIDLRDLSDACQTQGNDLALKEIEKLRSETKHRLTRLSDAREGIRAASIRKGTTDERLDALKDMLMHKATIDDILDEQNVKELIGVATQQVKRVIKV